MGGTGDTGNSGIAGVVIDGQDLACLEIRDAVGVYRINEKPSAPVPISFRVRIMCIWTS